MFAIFIEHICIHHDVFEIFSQKVLKEDRHKMALAGIVEGSPLQQLLVYNPSNSPGFWFPCLSTSRYAI